MTNMTIPEIPTRSSPTPRKSNTKIIIIAGIIIILCCLCLVLAGVLYYMGTRGTGPLAMLATDTPTTTPTRTSTPTSTPTSTFTPTQEISIVGEWTITFDWDCDGTTNSGALNFYDDYSFNVNNDPALWGTWFVVDDYVDFMFTEFPNTHYWGNLSGSGDYMDGDMDNLSDMTGCWSASR
jgi:hypothetical protein